MNLAILVSGGGLAFRAIALARARGLLELRGLHLICDRPSPALDFADKNRVDATLLNFSRFANREAFDSALVQTLHDEGVEAAILNFNRLLGPSALQAVGGHCVNLHLSLLPLFPGFGAVAKAIESGMKVAGVTFHWVDDTIDDGEIIAQGVVRIDPRDDVERLTRRLYRVAVPMQLQLARNLAMAGASARTTLAVDRLDDDIREFAVQFLQQHLGDPRDVPTPPVVIGAG